MIDTLERTLGELEERRIDRREAVRRVVALAAAFAGTGFAAAEPAKQAGARSSTFTATGLDHLALRVADPARSRDFYAAHLGLTVMSESASSCFMRCGETDFVALFRGSPAGMHHYSYAIPDYDPAEAVRRLEAAKLAPRREENRVYFDDPDGLTVQVS